MDAKQLEKFDEWFCETLKTNPQELLSFFLLQYGKMMVETNADTMDLKTDATILGNRYEVKCKIKKKIIGKK